jgi:CDGSH-type Zn-finger protein
MTEVTIRLRDNGPLIVQGAARIVDSEGNVFGIDPAKPLVALCRCGVSENKPFCDGSHKRCGFASAPRASS